MFNWMFLSVQKKTYILFFCPRVKTVVMESCFVLKYAMRLSFLFLKLEKTHRLTINLRCRISEKYSERFSLLVYRIYLPKNESLQALSS